MKHLIFLIAAGVAVRVLSPYAAAMFRHVVPL